MSTGRSDIPSRFRHYRFAVLAVWNDNLRGGVDVTVFQPCDERPSIVVVVRLRPHIGTVGLLVVFPILIKAQHVQFGRVNRAGFF